MGLINRIFGNSNKDVSKSEINKLSPMNSENKNETILCALRDRKYELKEFIESDFVNMDFVVLSNQIPQLENKSLAGPINLLTLNKGNEKYVALFTSANRSNLSRESLDEFKYAITMNCKNIIELTEGSYGVIINHKWDCELIIKNNLIKDFYNQLMDMKKNYLTKQEEVNKTAFSFTKDELENSEIKAESDIRGILEKIKIDPDQTTIFFQNDFIKINYTVLTIHGPNIIDSEISINLCDLLMMADQNESFVIPLFTDLALAESVKKQIPKYQYSNSIPGKTILKTLPRGYGVIINPNTEFQIPLPDSVFNFYSHLMPILGHRNKN
jgi:hypothetical protein